MKIPTITAFLLAVLATAGATSAARAGSEDAGTTAANFLSVGSGAAIQGRAGATLGLWGDLAMVGWNPSTLAWLRETELAFAHSTLIEEHTQDYMAIGGRLGRTPVRWSVSGLYENEGTFEARDEFNNPTGSFGVSRFAGGGHLAVPLGRNLAMGVGGKWVNENLGDQRGAGMTFDVGLQGRSGAFGFGAAAQNAFGTMEFAGQSFEFPTNYGVGVAWSHPVNGLRVAVDANFPSAYYTDVRSGLEWRWRDVLALRGGYRAELGAPEGEALSGPTFGMGTGAYGMWLDYAYVIPGMGDAQHRIGFSLRPSRMNAVAPFGGVAPSDDPEREPEATLPVAQAAPPEPAMASAPPAEKPKAEKPKAEKPKAEKKVRAPKPAPAPKAIVPEPAPVAANEVTPPAEVAPKVEKPKPVKAPKPAKTPKPAVAKSEPIAAAVKPPQPEVAAPPAAAPKPAAPAAPAVRPTTVKVAAGETLEVIAKRWGVSVPAMMMENDMVSTAVKTGKVLKLPAKGR